MQYCILHTSKIMLQIGKVAATLHYSLMSGINKDFFFFFLSFQHFSTIHIAVPTMEWHSSVQSSQGQQCCTGCQADSQRMVSVFNWMGLTRTKLHYVYWTLSFVILLLTYYYSLYSFSYSVNCSWSDAKTSFQTTPGNNMRALAYISLKNKCLHWTLLVWEFTLDKSTEAKLM